MFISLLSDLIKEFLCMVDMVNTETQLFKFRDVILEYSATLGHLYHTSSPKLWDHCGRGIRKIIKRLGQNHLLWT